MNKQPVWLSVVIPTLNEEKSIVEVLSRLQESRSEGVEVILCDGGSKDNTISVAKPFIDRFVYSKAGRANQMNRGAREVSASSEILWFLHADTKVPKDFLKELQTFRRTRYWWGAFDVQLDAHGYTFEMISWFINHRSYLSQICTGDQGLFITRKAWQVVEGFPDIPLMEDVEISKRLKALSKGYRIRKPLITSARRWEKFGTWKTILLMWKLRWMYYRGTNPSVLAGLYR